MGGVGLAGLLVGARQSELSGGVERVAPSGRALSQCLLSRIIGSIRRLLFFALDSGGLAVNGFGSR